MKSDGHLGRSYLNGRSGNQVNAVLSATGYNFRLILEWLTAFGTSSGAPSSSYRSPNQHSTRLLNGRPIMSGHQLIPSFPGRTLIESYRIRLASHNIGFY